jgi:hypothetical protein
MQPSPKINANRCGIRVANKTTNVRKIGNTFAMVFTSKNCSCRCCKHLKQISDGSKKKIGIINNNWETKIEHKQMKCQKKIDGPCLVDKN